MLSGARRARKGLQTSLRSQDAKAACNSAVRRREKSRRLRELSLILAKGGPISYFLDRRKDTRHPPAKAFAYRSKEWITPGESRTARQRTSPQREPQLRTV